MEVQGLGKTGAALLKLDAEELEILLPALRDFGRLCIEKRRALMKERFPGWRMNAAQQGVFSEICDELARKVAAVQNITAPPSRAEILRRQAAQCLARSIRKSSKREEARLAKGRAERKARRAARA